MSQPLSAALDSAEAESSSRRRTLLAAILAILMTGSVFLGYTYLRNRYAKRAEASATQPEAATQLIGPRKAEILVDEAMFDGDFTVIGGTVRNLSSETLTSLAVNLELKHRKDGKTQNTPVLISPTQLAPQQEGHYSLRLRSSEYNIARLVSLTAGADAAPLVYSTSPGKKRPLERLEGKTIYVDRPAPKNGEFINTPDTPGRIP